jgi:hypothetical protein
MFSFLAFKFLIHLEFFWCSKCALTFILEEKELSQLCQHRVREMETQRHLD